MDRTLAWDLAADQGTLLATIEPAPDAEWVRALDAALASRGDEVRGQRYREVWIEPEQSLVVDGVPPDDVQPTREFFEMIVRLATRSASPA